MIDEKQDTVTEESLLERYKNGMGAVAFLAVIMPVLITLWVVNYHPEFRIPLSEQRVKQAASPSISRTESLVVRAKQDIPRGITVTDEMLELVWVPEESNFEPLVLNLADAVGLRTTEEIPRGRLIRRAQIVAQ